jgi:exosome complex RNA-binding protein Csl4
VNDLKDKVTTPGEKLGVIEEFERLEGTYDDDGAIRASSLGTAKYDMTRRSVSVLLKKRPRMPRVGDSVIAEVESAQPAVVNSTILIIDGKKTDANLKGMMLLTREKHRVSRSQIPCSVGDIIRATVVSTLNSIIHVAFNKPEDGVVHTRCSICGGEMIRIQRQVKCIQCGNRVDKRLAPEFPWDKSTRVDF